MKHHIAAGLIAGAAGTVALNAASYLDMAVRGRGASSAPADTVGRVADKLGIPLAPEGEDTSTGENRRSGLGALLGYVTGLGVGAAYGALRGSLGPVPLPVAAGGLTVSATIGSAGPMALLGITDPRDWGAQSWVMDLVPHLAYGVVTAVVVERVVD